MSDETTATAEDTTDAKPHVSPDDWQKAQESISKLEAKVNELLGETKAEREKRRAAEEAAAKQAEEAARKSGDVEALEKSWQDKLTTREKELRAEMEQRDSWVKELTVGQAATSIAGELAVQGSASVLMPHIKARLGTDVRDGKPATVVLDKDGKPSAMTLDELKQEFANDPAFAPLIVGTKASGSGGVGGKGSASLKRGTMTAMQKSEYITEHGQAAFLKLPK
jgi:hypothetical protein